MTGGKPADGAGGPRRWRRPTALAAAHNRRMTRPLVFLVPGFFGFSTVGGVNYFQDVEQALGQALARRGLDARIVRCRTRPTASIRRRAAELCAEVARHGGLDAPALHFVGHSTGGLDLRLLLSPGHTLQGDADARRSAERIGALTRSAASVATPHHGTPLANHFASLQGQTLLMVLSGLATSGGGRGVIVAAAQAIALAAGLDDWLGRHTGPLDRLADGLLAKIRFDREDPLWQYLREIEADQGAVLQLTPEGIDLFDAAVADRPGVAYGSVVTAVPPPQESLSLDTLLDPEYLALRALFRGLHGLCARPHPHYPYPPVAPALQAQLDAALGFAATPAASDGVVPTLSQLHGRLLHVARADHLDIVGHYALAGGSADWLPSGAGFTPEAFAAAWDAVAEAIARAT